MPSDSTAIQARTVFRQPNAPDNTDAVWIDTSSGNAAKYYDGSDWIKFNQSSVQGPNPFDKTKRFDGTDATVSFTNCRSFSSGFPDHGVPDNPDSGETQDYGYKFTIKSSVGAVVSKLSQYIEGATQANLYDNDASTVLKTKDISGISPGETFTFEYDFSSGTDYWLTTGANGNSYTRVYKSNAASYPYDSPEIKILTSSSPGDVNDDFYNMDWVRTYPDISRDGVALMDTPSATSGEVVVEWGDPGEDVYEWDAATFTRTPDGETVDVYAEYSDDGGSTWNVANGGSTIGRNYDLGSDPDVSATSEVRLRFELSRSDTSNIPSADSAYRSWFL